VTPVRDAPAQASLGPAEAIHVYLTLSRLANCAGHSAILSSATSKTLSAYAAEARVHGRIVT
jgi:hypothetical protein